MRERALAAGVFAVIAAAFFLLNWGERTGSIRWERFLNPCGFKQRTGLPCPTCGMTTAVRAFVVGRVGDAFRVQAVAATLCVFVSVVGVLALAMAIAGREWGLVSWVKGWHLWRVLLIVLIVILAAWISAVARIVNEPK